MALNKKLKDSFLFIKQQRNFLLFTFALFLLFFLIGLIFPNLFVSYQEKLVGTGKPEDMLSTFVFIIFNNIAKSAYLNSGLPRRKVKYEL